MGRFGRCPAGRSSHGLVGRYRRISQPMRQLSWSGDDWSDGRIHPCLRAVPHRHRSNRGHPRSASKRFGHVAGGCRASSDPCRHARDRGDESCDGDRWLHGKTRRPRPGSRNWPCTCRLCCGTCARLDVEAGPRDGHHQNGRRPNAYGSSVRRIRDICSASRKRDVHAAVKGR